jgi:hypothetical protein
MTDTVHLDLDFQGKTSCGLVDYDHCFEVYNFTINCKTCIRSYLSSLSIEELWDVAILIFLSVSKRKSIDSNITIHSAILAEVLINKRENLNEA